MYMCVRVCVYVYANVCSVYMYMCVCVCERLHDVSKISLQRTGQFLQPPQAFYVS